MKNKPIELIDDCRCMDGCGMDLVEKQADYLIANGVTIQRWIPVEEGLPGYGERVLITNGTSVWESYLSISHKWVRYEGIWMDIQVTHWMPLPEPPKEKA